MTLTQLLAAWGLVLFGAQLWTWAHYFAAGPHVVQPTGPIDTVSWWACRFFEASAISTAFGVGTFVVRRCLRERKLTFDAKFCIAGFLTYWCDPLVNFFEPIFLQSSNWMNWNEWTAHVPFMVNPDAGRLPHPFLFLWPLYTFGFLSFATMANGLMARVHTARPSLSPVALYFVAFGAGTLLEASFEIPALLLGVWSFPGSPDAFAIFPGTRFKYPWPEWLTAGIVFGTFSSVRYFRDAAGRPLPERGLERLPPAARAAASILAMVAILNSLMIGASLLDAVVGLYSAPYPADLPAHLWNGACDAPGFSGTRYGPCPGSPGFRMPLPGSL